MGKVNKSIVLAAAAVVTAVAYPTAARSASRVGVRTARVVASICTQTVTSSVTGIVRIQSACISTYLYRVSQPRGWS